MVIAVHPAASHQAPVTSTVSSLPPAGGDEEGGMEEWRGSERDMDRGGVRGVTPSCTRKLPPAWHSWLLFFHYRWPVEVGGGGEREESGHLGDTIHVTGTVTASLYRDDLAPGVNCGGQYSG